MAAPAAAAAPVYIGGAALFAGAVYLATPQGQRAAESLGEAMGQGASNAWDNLASLFRADDQEKSETVPTTGTAKDTTTRECDGPHRGRFQAQGYNGRIDPSPLEISAPWARSCTPPLKPEGLHLLSNVLLMQVRMFNYASAGLRAPAFSRMSQHVRSAPAIGFVAGHRRGFGITPQGQVRPNTAAGPNAPRVDLEVITGRAFGAR